MIQRLFIFLTFIAITSIATAQQNVYIPDPNFKNALINHNPVIDTDHNGEISYTEAVNFTGKINVSAKNITSLQGIEKFVNITELDCSNNNNGYLSNDGSYFIQTSGILYLDLSNNIALKKLNCAVNSLVSLNVNSNTKLEFLDCSSNMNWNNYYNGLPYKLTSLDVSNCNLKYLNCINNEISSLNINNNPNLEYLYCGSNRITNLELSNKTKLIELICSGNKLTSLDVKNSVNLFFLECSHNYFTNLDLNNNVALKYLFCFNNSNYPLTSLDLSNNINLVFLYTYSLEILNISHCINLKHLLCYYCPLTDLDISNNVNLSTLLISQSKLTSLDISNNPFIENIFCRENELLTTLNLKNGNNQNFNFDNIVQIYKEDNDFFNYTPNNDYPLISYWFPPENKRFLENPNLLCIEVDNQAYSNANWSDKKDTWACYRETPCITPTFNDLDEICQGSTLPPTSDNGIAGVWSPNNTNNLGTHTYIFTPNVGCQTKITKQITVKQKQESNFSFSTTFCQNETPPTLPILSDNGFSGTWSPNVIDTSSSGGKYYLFTPNADQCAIFKYVYITVTPKPTLNSFTSQGNITTICVGESVTLVPSSNDYVPGSSVYNWTEPSGATFVSFKVDIENADGCVSEEKEITITVKPKPTLNSLTSQGNITTICIGESVTLVPSSNDYVPGSSVYNWTEPSGATFVSENFGTRVYKINQPGSYTFKVDIENADGCVSEEKEITIIVEPKPSIDLLFSDAVNNVVCEEQKVIISVNGSNITSYAYFITGPNTNIVGVSGSDGTLKPTFEKEFIPNIAGSYNVKIRGNNSNSVCSFDEKEITIIVKSNPIINVSSNATNDRICLGQSVTLTASGATTYIWNGLSGNGNQQTVSPTTDTTYKVIGIGANGCQSEEKEIKIKVTPVTQGTTPTFSNLPTAICVGEIYVLPTISSEGISGTWSPAFDNQADTEYTFTPDPEFTNCVSNVNVKHTIKVNPANTKPTFDNLPTAICVGENYVLPTISSEGISGTWLPAFDNQADTEYTFTPNPEFTNCVSNVNVKHTINVTQPSTTPTFDNLPTAICYGETYVLPTISSEGISGTWTPAFDNTSTTEYTFTADAGQGCSVEEVKVTVIVNPAGALFIDVEAQDLTVECDGLGNVIEFQNWLDNNGGAVVNTQLTWTHNYQGGLYDLDCNGNAEVTFTGIDDCGNFITTKATFKIEDTTKPAFVGDLPQDANVLNCDELDNIPTLEATDNCDTNVVVTLDENRLGDNPKNYILIRTWTATDLCGNKITHTQRLNVVCTTKIEIYNGISANSDGLNDIFYIDGIEKYPENVVRIFNRWGVEVYKESGYDNQTKYWDGNSKGNFTYKNRKATEGSYFYILEYKDLDNQIVKESGYIYLSR